MDVEVIVEVPRGSRNKYESDHDTGAIWLDRMLFTATQYPADYGYIPETLAPDGDPLDAMVLMDEPTFPGCHVHGRVVGVFRMRDEEGGDDKIVAVPATDPRWEAVRDVTDLPEHLTREIGHFFEVYKDLEPGKDTDTRGWGGAGDAERIVEEARRGRGPLRAVRPPGSCSGR